MSIPPAEAATATDTAPLGDIAGLIADLVRAGFDAGLIGRTAALLAGQGQGVIPAPTLRQAATAAIAGADI